MKTLRLRDAQARLSAIVEAAENGEATIITRDGRPAAMVVPIEDGRRLYDDDRPSLADYLLDFPGPLEVSRDQIPLRAADL
ncbi:type II toxin-antitoxin system Phd/YefM family antitoxin [Inquilinus limosus]|uniref:type II toxin-antitoxin system Phd/YefM family antitoxin n=1 Tax=Inquilinus limosus TaxID=171674 RepID=UPI00047DF76F|nr:type II toxin-antitoxin system Phd/YefM family antitoxin [Inquilinus limosus]